MATQQLQQQPFQNQQQQLFTLTAIISSVSGLTLAAPENTFSMSIAAVRAPFRHLDRRRGHELHHLRVPEVIVHGDEPVALAHVQR
jgi:hypothetical protein